MKETPKGWPRLTSSLFYENAGAAIDWLCRAFGFEVQLKVEGEGGRIEHSQLTYGEALVMVGDVGGPEPWHALMASPGSVGGKNTQVLCIMVDDADAHCARARASSGSDSSSTTPARRSTRRWRLMAGRVAASASAISLARRGCCSSR